MKQFIGFDVDESSYAESFNVTGDTIFKQFETDYDDASDVIRSRKVKSQDLTPDAPDA